MLVRYPASLVHCDTLDDRKEPVVRFSVDVERFSVFPFHVRFIPAVILFDGVV